MEFVYGPDYENVDPSSPFVPAHVVGRVQGGGDGGRAIAVAVNGEIVGVGETFTLATGDEGELVSVIVPPDSFKPGRNEVRVYLAADQRASRVRASPAASASGGSSGAASPAGSRPARSSCRCAARAAAGGWPAAWARSSAR